MNKKRICNKVLVSSSPSLSKMISYQYLENTYNISLPNITYTFSPFDIVIYAKTPILFLVAIVVINCVTARLRPWIPASRIPASPKFPKLEIFPKHVR